MSKYLAFVIGSFAAIILNSSAEAQKTTGLGAAAVKNNLGNIYINITQTKTLSSALPNTNCVDGVLFYSLPRNENVLIPEQPRSCKSFLEMPSSEITAQDRLTMDQNIGQAQVEWLGNGVQWAKSQYHDNVTMQLENTGKVSIEVQGINQLTSKNRVEIMKNDVGFPREFVLRAGEEILVPLGSMFDIARRLGVGYFDSSAQYDVTTSTDSCGPTLETNTETSLTVIDCRYYGFSVITSFVDIFGQKNSITSIAYLRVSRNIDQQFRSYILPPKVN
jgi:hypothetical protein